MLHHLFNTDQPWFEPKRFGYGAGLPIAWQGWILILTHMGVILGIVMLLTPLSPLARAVLALTISLAPMPIYARRTRGGWRWRWGND